MGELAGTRSGERTDPKPGVAAPRCRYLNERNDGRMFYGRSHASRGPASLDRAPYRARC
jgi:hypothetical protein